MKQCNDDTRVENCYLCLVHFKQMLHRCVFTIKLLFYECTSHVIFERTLI